MLAKPPDPILLTRSLRDAPIFSKLLHRHNRATLGCPSIRIVENPALYDLDFLSGYYDSIIFNSRYSVHILFRLLKKRGILNYFVKAKRIFAIGPETAKVIKSYGVHVDLMPKIYAATGMVELFKHYGITRQQILLTAGDRSDTWLMSQLDAMGNQCTPIEVYQNHAPKELPKTVCESLDSGKVSCLAATSPSAILNLLSVQALNGYNHDLRSIPVASIGPKTSKACKSLGFDVMVESPKHTLYGLAESIVERFV